VSILWQRLVERHVHLVIEDFGLSRLGLWNKGLVEDVKHILTDLLELGFDLLAVFADGGDVFVGALGFLLLLNRRDDSPGSTSGSDDILVSHGEEVSLINGQLAAQLDAVSLVDLTPSTAGVDARWQPLSCS
jgi:hypothetical protein